MSNIAIILGAGSGSRMKIDKSKLLLDLGGKTVIQRSVDAFLDISDIDEIIVTLREEDVDEFSSLITDERVSFVIGGKTRQKSVKNAVDTIDECDLIIIHDGARPLVKSEDIEKAIRQAKDFGAASLGVKVKDTIKVTDKDGFVVSTPDRSTLFSVQTPQIFNFALYKQAIEKAEKENKDFTDDCQLIEYIGHKVKMVEGSYSNIKITTQEDIPLAESFLKMRN
ncbi:MAG: 2-C-methyl-D-erythritol 4-phosphate cytidylyltransferase [Eubacterium sp.]|nr:2-C-methyl-D-erythritol 4-phosphate cytidylyltransferase [Eubacterium sp.]